MKSIQLRKVVRAGTTAVIALVVGCSLFPIQVVSAVNGQQLASWSDQHSPKAMSPEPATRQASPATEGYASWYDAGFHGGRTMSGERYDHTAMTAAHESLPFDTMVRVTRLDTGETVVVRINDRMESGPQHIIDLSGAAAENLGLMKDDTALVRLDVLEDVSSGELATEGNMLDSQESLDSSVRPRRVITHTWGGPVRSEEPRSASSSKINQADPPDQAERFDRESTKRISNVPTVPVPGDADDSVVTRTGELITLQIGVFTTLSGAQILASQYDKAWIARVSMNGNPTYRVYFSRFEKEKPARLAQSRLWEEGQDSFLRKVQS